MRAQLEQSLRIAYVREQELSVLAAFAQAFRQLPDPAFRRVVIRSALLSAVVFVLLAIAVGWLLLQIGGISIFG